MTELMPRTPEVHPDAARGEPAAATAGRPSRWTTILSVLGGMGLFGLFLAALWAARHILQTYRAEVPLATSILLLTVLIVALLFGFMITRELVHWRRSTRVLAKLINELRAGDAPLSDLDRIRGGVGVLVEPVRSILLDLREAKRTNVSLNEEMRSRILSRTDALERQLGSLKAQASRDAPDRAAPIAGRSNRCCRRSSPPAGPGVRICAPS